MRPKPMISNVLPIRSIGRADMRSPQRFACTMACSSAPRLASANMKCIACSATDGELAVPAIISGTLWRVSAGTSTVS